MEDEFQVIEIGEPNISALHESEQNAFFRTLFESLLKVLQPQPSEDE